MDENPRACRDAMRQLAQCLAKTQCIRDGHTAQECMRANAAPECEVRWRTPGMRWMIHACMHSWLWIRVRVGCGQVYRSAFFECKRGQLDMRTRIRGPKYTDILEKADP